MGYVQSSVLLEKFDTIELLSLDKIFVRQSAGLLQQVSWWVVIAGTCFLGVMRIVKSLWWITLGQSHRVLLTKHV